ncbi:MAG: GNAT family N-acetyltransferase [Acidimicrobiia bacterium]
MSEVTPEQLHALCEVALPLDALSVDDLRESCFGPGAESLGGPDGAVVWTHRQFATVSTAWILLLAVAPTRRRDGIGRTLVEEVTARARAVGVGEIHTGNCAPRYVWPGVDLTSTAALAFFQQLGFEAYDHGLNMSLPTSFRVGPPPGITVERETGDGAVELADREFPHWVDEIERGIRRGTTFAARDASGVTVAFGAHSVNRRAWIGPMATDPGRRQHGVGHAILGALAEDIATTWGDAQAEIAWVAPIPFYAKAGAVASRAFRMHRLQL